MRNPSSTRRRPQRRGFALFVVVLLLALMSAAIAVTMSESADNIRNAGIARTREEIKGGIERGLAAGLQYVQTLDPAHIEDPANDWDIFGAASPVGVNDLITPIDAGRYEIRIGLRPGQRARAPAGEDIRHSYGQVVELQVGVAANQVGMPPAEERVSVGLLIPRHSSHSN